MKAREIADALGGTVSGDPELEITHAVHPDHASGKADLAVAVIPSMFSTLSETRAAAALAPLGLDDLPISAETIIRIPISRKTLPEASKLFMADIAPDPGIHPSTVVSNKAKIGKDARIGPFCVISDDAIIEDDAILQSHVTVMKGASIGPSSVLHPGVRIGPNVKIGARAILQANAVIGADGFSFLPVDQGHVEYARTKSTVAPENHDATLLKVQSLGGVIIGDDVEIGALTAIDAGTLVPTRIRCGTKIDDLVMIGHNVQVGEDCLLCAQVGIAGSATIGDRVVLAGRVGVADHKTIGDDVVVGGASAVGSNLRSREIYLGVPAIPQNKALRDIRNIRKLDRMMDKLTALLKQNKTPTD